MDCIEIQPPMIITPRLLPGVKIEDGFISIEKTEKTEGRGKPIWRWFVDIPEGEFTRDDLAGCEGHRGMMESMLAFLEAAAESYPDGENADLFPIPVVEWAQHNSDEICMIRTEIESGPMITDIKVLAEIVGADPTERSLSRRVYKSTECGAWLVLVEGGVRVGSIVEGTDRCADPVTLTYPFLAGEFWEALEDIERQCNTIWKETHGCEKCWPEGTVDQYGNEFKPGEVGAPVNPECPGCGGDGIIL